MRRLKTGRRPPIYPKTPGHLPCSSLTHPLPLPSRRPSVSFGGFGLRERGVEYDPEMTQEVAQLMGFGAELSEAEIEAIAERVAEKVVAKLQNLKRAE